MQKPAMIAALALAPMLLSAAEANVTAAEAFKQLTALVGEWEGNFFRMAACTPSPTASPPRAAFSSRRGRSGQAVDDSLQHRRKRFARDALPARQPATPAPGARKASTGLSFEFLDGGNLHVRGKSHQQLECG